MSKEQRIEACVRSYIKETIATNALQNVPNVLFIKAKDLFYSQSYSSSCSDCFYGPTIAATGENRNVRAQVAFDLLTFESASIHAKGFLRADDHSHGSQ